MYELARTSAYNLGNELRSNGRRGNFPNEIGTDDENGLCLCQIVAIAKVNQTELTCQNWTDFCQDYIRFS